MSLNVAQLHELEQPFNELRAKIRHPDYVRDALVRVLGEIPYVFKLKITWLNPIFRKAVSRIKRPSGWRRKALVRMRAKTLKDLGISKPNNLYRQLGRLQGVHGNSASYLGEMSFLSAEEEYWDKAFKPFLDIDEETQRKIEAHWEKMDSDRKKIDAWAETLEFTEQKEIAVGKAEKMNAVFSRDGSFSHNPKTADVYIFLLMSGEAVRRLPSVEIIYEFMLSCFGEDFEYDLGAFARLCTHIDYQGANHRASMKRVRSVDRRNAHVLTG